MAAGDYAVPHQTVSMILIGPGMTITHDVLPQWGARALPRGWSKRCSVRIPPQAYDKARAFLTWTRKILPDMSIPYFSWLKRSAIMALVTISADSKAVPTAISPLIAFAKKLPAGKRKSGKKGFMAP